MLRTAMATCCAAAALITSANAAVFTYGDGAVRLTIDETLPLNVLLDEGFTVAMAGFDDFSSTGPIQGLIQADVFDGDGVVAPDGVNFAGRLAGLTGPAGAFLEGDGFVRFETPDGSPVTIASTADLLAFLSSPSLAVRVAFSGLFETDVDGDGQFEEIFVGTEFEFVTTPVPLPAAAWLFLGVAGAGGVVRLRLGR